jgi:hypothetical protein
LALYENRFTRNLNSADAVRQASLSVLRVRRTNGVSTHPFYWAAFVAAGDWRWPAPSGIDNKRLAAPVTFRSHESLQWVWSNAEPHHRAGQGVWANRHEQLSIAERQTERDATLDARDQRADQAAVDRIELQRRRAMDGSSRRPSPKNCVRALWV